MNWLLLLSLMSLSSVAEWKRCFHTDGKGRLQNLATTISYDSQNPARIRSLSADDACSFVSTYPPSPFSLLKDGKGVSSNWNLTGFSDIDLTKSLAREVGRNGQLLRDGAIKASYFRERFDSKPGYLLNTRRSSVRSIIQLRCSFKIIAMCQLNIH